MRSATMLFGLVIVGVAMGTVWSRMLDRVVFHPTPGVDLRPEEIGVDAEDIYLSTSDGVRIHSFYLPDGRGTSRAILFLHGNAGNASHRLPNAAELARLGAAVLLLDYRGYGLSEGTPEEAGVYLDARAGLGLLEERGFPPDRIVLFGRSLGGAVAVDLAVDRPLAGLILESTFTSGADMARSAFGIPLGALVGSRWDSMSKIVRVRCPILFFHGDRDEVVPFSLGRRLYEAAPEPKAFETIGGAGHNDTTIVGGADYFARIGTFLDRVAPRGEVTPR